jgi:ubiquinone biosynthesis protein
MAFERAKERAPRSASKGRHEEVVSVLAAWGLWRGPRLLPRGATARDREEPRARRLRAALESLGPVFSSFGLYMATRVDLLPAEDRLELAAIADRPAALPAVARGLIARELGRAPEEVFRAIEETPLASRLLSQTHRAWLGDGRPVTVEFLRPKAEESFTRDAELLHLLKVALGGCVGSAPALDGAIDDFRSVLAQKADLQRAAGALETLASDAEDFGILRVPLLHRELCTHRMLTVERLPGMSLSEVPPPPSLREAGADAEAHEEFDREDLARRLCVVWLRQAMLGSLFPVELTPEAVTILPNGQIALAGGVFTALPPESRTNLWGYLIAASSEDANRACSYLTEELAGDKSERGADQLRQRFRQLAPFRDVGWDGGDGNSLAARLCTHWKLAGECGRAPRPAAVSFYRGVMIAAGLARWLAPDRDSLTEALQDVRLIAGLEKLRAMAGPDQFADQLHRYAAVAVDLPQRLDEALTLVASGDARLKFQMPETAERRARQNSSAKVTALLLVLAAFVVWAQSPAASLAGAWGDGVKAFIFVVLGALVLRAASRA